VTPRERRQIELAAEHLAEIAAELDRLSAQAQADGTLIGDSPGDVLATCASIVLGAAREALLSVATDLSLQSATLDCPEWADCQEA